VTRNLFASLACILCFAPAGSAQDAGPSIALSAAAYAGGTLQPGERHTERTLTVDAARGLTIVVTSRVELEVSLQFPDGTLASPRQPDDRLRWFPFAGGESGEPLLPGAGSGFNTLVTVAQPPAGRYIVQLNKPLTQEPVPFLVTLIQDSDMRLGLVTPFTDALRGGPFFVSAVVLEANRPVRGAVVIAQVTRTTDDPAAVPIPAGEVRLMDDGTGADAAAGDGVYSGVVAAAARGTHWIAVRATGTGSIGAPFERHAGARFEVSDATVTIERVGPSVWQEVARTSRIARLSVPVRLAGPAGRYEVVVTLRARNGRRTGGAALVELRGNERARATVEVDAASVRLLGADGPYVLESTEIFEFVKQGRVLRARTIGVDKTPVLRVSSLGPG
jgi:hypothetical protein